MSKKLAIIHTTPVTVDALKQLAQEQLSSCEVINFVDDSILPQLAANGGNLDDVKERLCAYAVFAEQQQADVILSACSSVGDVAAMMQERVRIPVVRIDEAMAEKAVRMGRRIGVAATLNTTLQPTLQLLKRKADEAGAEVAFEPALADEAYRKLIAGDKDGHDEVLANVLAELIERVDAVVLAQASMARVVSRLPEQVRDRFLTSPALGMARVRETVEGGA